MLLQCTTEDAAMQKPGVRKAWMASAKFFRKQAERCADLARRTNDQDSRERCEQLQRTYRYLAEMEEQYPDEPSSDTTRRPAA
jgi:hypothetical protein